MIKSINQDRSFNETLYNEHLKKFKDLDNFLNQKGVLKIIIKYWEEKTFCNEEFDNLKDFIKYLKKWLNIYISYLKYDGDIDEARYLLEKIENFTNIYHELIYFGDKNNPVKERKNRLHKDGESTKDKVNKLL